MGAKRAAQRKQSVPFFLDRENIRTRTAQSTAFYTAQLVDLAQAEACEAVGEKSRALEFAGRHAFGDP